MITPTLLGPLSSLHEILTQLPLSVPSDQAALQYHPRLGSLNWYLGHSVYLETYWLRQVLCGDADLTNRVEQLFTSGGMSLAEQCAALPPLDHLLNWAAEIQSEHLRRLANPGELPQHPLLEQDRLVWFLLQEQARNYEQMLMVLNQRQLQLDQGDYQVQRPLQSSQPQLDAQKIVQGHFRIGAVDDPAAYDNELPPQAVELSGFRTARRPVSNAEYLAFMEQGGYQNRGWWSDEGWQWRQDAAPSQPDAWRRDAAGHWYAVAVNGPADLNPEDPVSGISRHEAGAFASWTASLGGELAGAVLQHEYQWEVAARMGALKERGRVREWCANPFHPYPEYQPFPDPKVSQRFFEQGHISLRGGSLHTQRPLRRLSCREHLEPDVRYAFSGARLVFPPGE